MRLNRSGPTVPFLHNQDQDDATLKAQEVDALRVEYRRLVGRINYRTRRSWMFLGLLLLTLLAFVVVTAFVLSPAEWTANQQSRFTQMTALLILVGVAMPLGGYFARRFDRQRERVKLARTRQYEVLNRLAQLDEVGAGARRRRRRRKTKSWSWRVAQPDTFSRPPLENLAGADLEDMADQLGSQVNEERAMRALAYLHAGITGGGALIFAFVVTLAGPEYLSAFLGGRQWGGGAGLDPLMFWLMMTIILVIIGGFASHRVTALLRHARAYHDRLRAVERALWDARVLLRERREEV